MANNEYVGNGLVATWVYSGGTINLETDSRNFSYTPGVQYADATAGADANKRWIKTFTSGAVTIETVAQTDGTLMFNAFAEGTTGTLTWGESGTVAGRAKHSMACLAGGVDQRVPYADVVTYTINLMQNGTRTDTVWP